MPERFKGEFLTIGRYKISLYVNFFPNELKLNAVMLMILMQMLISVTSCNVNAADNDQTTPLVMAALQGNAVICETLVRSLRPNSTSLSLCSFSALVKRYSYPCRLHVCWSA